MTSADDQLLDEIMQREWEAHSMAFANNKRYFARAVARAYHDEKITELQERIIELELEVERQHKVFYRFKTDAGSRYNLPVHDYAPHPLLIKEPS